MEHTVLLHLKNFYVFLLNMIQIALKLLFSLDCFQLTISCISLCCWVPQGQDEFQSTLLQIVEVMSQQSTTLLAHPDSFIAKVLPSLAILYDKNTDGDMRFLCLKVFFDILVVFLDDISSVNSTEDQQPSATVLSAPRRYNRPICCRLGLFLVAICC